MGNCCFRSAKPVNPSSSGTQDTKGTNKKVVHSSSSNPTTSSSSSSSSNTNTSQSSASSIVSKNESTIASPISYSSPSSLKPFTLNELKTATRNFRSDSLLGEGGFGYVYKGWIDETTLAPTRQGLGIVVAVKKLKSESFQGHKEWLAEVNYLGQFSHPNLVKLIGYCLELEQRLLVYEYLGKGSLENHLFRRGFQPLPWGTRINIAIGVARGLDFLHDREPMVIFRDLKTSNVLLDSDFNPKLSDFGLARDGPKGDNTHVSTRVVGTRGYAAPEYIATGHLTVKSDIYSYGVVLLELLSGQRAMDDEKYGVGQSLVDWAKPFLIGDKRKLLRIMDLKLEGQYSKKGAQTAAHLALQCLSNDPKNRPQVRDIVITLEELQTSKT